MTDIVHRLQCPTCGAPTAEIRREVPRTETVRFVRIGEIAEIAGIVEHSGRAIALSIHGGPQLSIVFGVMGQRVWITATRDGGGDRGGPRRILRWILPHGLEIDGGRDTIRQGDHLWLEVGDDA